MKSPVFIPLRDAAMAALSRRLWRHIPRAVDLRGTVADAWDAVHSSPDQPFVIEVPLSDCLGLMPAAFRCDRCGGHPFVETLSAMMEGRVTDYVGSPLEAFYRDWQPASAAEVIGVAGASALRWLPPLASVLPWDRLTPDEHLRLWTDIALRDYRENGFDLPPDSGWKGWGPVHPAAGQAEYLRLSRAMRAIRSHGYQRHAAYDGDIAAQVLCHGDRLRYALGPGQHRVAALSALGYEDVPLRCDPHFIRREDAERWPNVRRGIYTRDQALAVFDRIFAARQPQVDPVTPPRTTRNDPRVASITDQTTT